MLQCGAIWGHIERPFAQNMVAGGLITPVHDLNVPYEGPLEEYVTPTAELLFPPTPLQTPMQTPLSGIGDQGMYNIPTAPSDYAPSLISDVRNGLDMRTGRRSPFMQPPSPWMNNQPLGVDVNVAYQEGRDDADRGVSHQSLTQDFLMMSPRKRKRDDNAPHLKSGGQMPQQDGSGDVTIEFLLPKFKNLSSGHHQGAAMTETISSKEARGGLLLPQRDGIPDEYDELFPFQGVATEDYNTPAADHGDHRAPTPSVGTPKPSKGEAADDDEPPLNEDDDDDDLDDLEEGEEETRTQHLVLAQFDKVARTKSKWRCTVKGGIMHLNNRDVLFNKLIHGSASASSVPSSSSFYGSNLKKARISTGSFKVMAAGDLDESKQTSKDKWSGLAYDISDDQQDITRGKGLVDTLFQAPMNDGTHIAVMSSHEYISQGLREYSMDNTMDGFYVAPAFMDKLVVHITKNFMSLPNIKVPLILGIWGGKGQGKSFQCELVLRKMGINPIMMSAGELESGNAGEPAKLVRQRYREAADIIAKGKMCCLFINDLDAGAGRMGGTTQYTVNNQMVNATLMNIADNPTNVQLPGMYNKQENARVPIIVTGNDFSTLYAPLIRDGRMEKFYWAPTRADSIGVCKGIFRSDNVAGADIVKLVDTFPGQSIDFFGALRARVYDDEVRKWVADIGVEKVGKRLVNSLEGPPTFQQPKMTLEKLLQYGNMLVQEQENVKRVQLADKYLSEAALGDANEDARKTGTFYGKAAQQIMVPVPEGCADPSATNYDPTIRSDDGSCTYKL